MKSSYTAFLVGNSEIASVEIIRRYIPENCLIVAVDGGIIHLKPLSLKPDLIIGDFDSIPDDLLEYYRKSSRVRVRHDPSQDENDLEKAVLFLEKQGVRNLVLAGFLGGRDDQSLANLLFLEKKALDLDILLLSMTSAIYFVRSSFSLSVNRGDTISLIAFHPVESIFTAGLKYNLKGETLHPGTHGISNEAVDEKVEIHLDKGILLVYHLF